jgi:hypothetical protein
MTCTWQHLGSKDRAIGPCGKEGNPFCKEHQFIADVLAETESVTREIHEQRETALTDWREELRRFRLLSEEADQLAPSAFVKRVHELLPDLHRAAMAAVVYTHLTSVRKED